MGIEKTKSGQPVRRSADGTLCIADPADPRKLIEISEADIDLSGRGVSARAILRCASVEEVIGEVHVDRVGAVRVRLYFDPKAALAALGPGAIGMSEKDIHPTLTNLELTFRDLEAASAFTVGRVYVLELGAHGWKAAP